MTLTSNDAVGATAFINEEKKDEIELELLKLEETNNAEIESAIAVEVSAQMVPLARIPKSTSVWEIPDENEFLEKVYARYREERTEGILKSNWRQRRINEYIDAAKDRVADQFRFELTDSGNVERLTQLHGDKFRYCTENKLWFVWNGSRWEPDQKNVEINEKAKEAINTIYLDAKLTTDSDEAKRITFWYKASQSKTNRKNMLDLTKTERGIATSYSEFDKEGWLLNVQNGTLDLKTGTLREPRREDLITKMANVRYDASADGPMFKAFLERIFDGNQELIKFVQSAAGYSLSGDTAAQCFFVLHGKGKNGKSTLLNIFRAILGDFAMGVKTKSLLTENRAQINEDIARLAGARFVNCSEITYGKILDESLVKELTGSEKVVARKLYENSFEFVPAFKLWMSVNHKPIVKGNDDGIWRRIRLIPFEVQIPDSERVDDYDKKLVAAEGPAILNWMLEGLRSYQQHGLYDSEEVRLATSGYREEMDILGTFIQDECACHPSHEIASSTLYSDYKEWSKENGFYPLNATAFKRNMQERGFKYIR